MNPRFKLILTADYEVWGNGSGCVERCVIDPSERMMQIAEQFNARITFFFDVCEYWAFKDCEEKGFFKNNYRPASLMRNQLRDAMKRGHDVQLHFHPQWLNYKFISNQVWELDYRYWRLDKVDNYHSEEWNLDTLFSKGIETLNNMFLDINPDYKVHTFRAGAWCIQPSEKIIEKLVKFKIDVDSTVVPGSIFDDGLTKFDFSKTPNKSCWKAAEHDITIEDKNSKLIEIPIASVKLNVIQIALLKMYKVFNLKHIFPESCVKKKVLIPTRNKFLIDKIKGILPQFRMLNFSDGTSNYEAKKIIDKIIMKYNTIDHTDIPIVAISHPKSFGRKNPLKFILTYINKLGFFEASSYKEYLESKGAL